jgi:DNA replicative helicase MCM subunit Mcm2 (Cdc46/Mcm family)
MSRFDLLFVVCDDMDEVNDYAIAQHIVHLHQHRKPAPMAEPDFTTGQVRVILKRILYDAYTMTITYTKTYLYSSYTKSYTMA